MKKGFNLATKDLFDSIVNTINESGLPYVMIKYVLKDILTQVEKLEENSIQSELAEYREKLDKDKKQSKSKETK